MHPFIQSLLFIIWFIGTLLVLYVLVKTVTVAVLDAKAHVKERKTNDGKE